MSKINPKRFLVEDFQTQKDWIGNLLSSLNQFINEVVTGFSNGFSVEDNLFQEIKELKFIYTSNNFPIKFATKFRSSPKGLVLIYAYNSSDSASLPAAPWVKWSYGDGEIKIADIAGLTIGKTYIIRFHVIYG